MPAGYDNRVQLLDAVCGMSLLPERSADIVIADPPYNIGKDFGECGDDLSEDEYIRWSSLWIGKALRLLKDTGAMYVYGTPEGISMISGLIPGGFGKRWLIWHYSNRASPRSRTWQRSFEAILEVSGKDFRLNVDAVREPYTEAYLGCAGKPRKPGRARYGNSGSVYSAHPGGALPRDVIRIPALAGRPGARERIRWCEDCGAVFRGRGHEGHEVVCHPTQKPAALTKRLILAAVPEGPFTAAIPFAGSGSECAIVKEMGGRFASFELNPKYALMAQRVVDESI